MKIVVIVVIVFLTSCNNKVVNYEKRIDYCLENTVKLPFTTADGKEGFSHHVPKDCIVGAILPEFSGETMQGNLISRELIYGKVNFINFWFIECPPCVRELPYLSQLKEKYGEEEVNFVSICRNTKEDLESFLDTVKFDFATIPSGEKITKENFKSMWGYPFNIITNKENVITTVFTGFPEEHNQKEMAMEEYEHALDERLGR